MNPINAISNERIRPGLNYGVAAMPCYGSVPIIEATQQSASATMAGRPCVELKLAGIERLFGRRQQAESKTAPGDTGSR